MLHVCVVLYTLSIGKNYVAQDSAKAVLSVHLSYKCCAGYMHTPYILRMCSRPLESMVCGPCRRNLVLHVCTCGVVYIRHWRQGLKEFVAIPVCSTEVAVQFPLLGMECRVNAWLLDLSAQ